MEFSFASKLRVLNNISPGIFAKKCYGRACTIKRTFESKVLVSVSFHRNYVNAERSNEYSWAGALESTANLRNSRRNASSRTTIDGR